MFFIPPHSCEVLGSAAVGRSVTLRIRWQQLSPELLPDSDPVMSIPLACRREADREAGEPARPSLHCCFPKASYYPALPSPCSDLAVGLALALEPA